MLDLITTNLSYIPIYTNNKTHSFHNPSHFPSLKNFTCPLSPSSIRRHRRWGNSSSGGGAFIERCCSAAEWNQGSRGLLQQRLPHSARALGSTTAASVLQRARARTPTSRTEREREREREENVCSDGEVGGECVVYRR